MRYPLSLDRLAGRRAKPWMRRRISASAGYVWLVDDKEAAAYELLLGRHAIAAGGNAAQLCAVLLDLLAGISTGLNAGRCQRLNASLHQDRLFRGGSMPSVTDSSSRAVPDSRLPILESAANLFCVTPSPAARARVRSSGAAR
jgi:hypothetical protein